MKTCYANRGNQTWLNTIKKAGHNNMKNDIYKLHKTGFNLVPIADKTKRPGVSTWRQWTQDKQTESDINNLFTGNYYGVGLICGQVSGIEVLDIDCKYDLTGTLFEDLLTIVFGRDNNLIKKIACQKTVSGGYHLIYKCSSIAGNQKLAIRAATEQELSKYPNRKQYEVIETRGEGGYICCDPTPGYKFVTEQCGFDFSSIFDLKEITPEERVTLITSAKALNQAVAPVNAVKNEPDQKPNSEWIISPLDDYNDKVSDQDMLSLLQKHKWTITKQTSKIIHLARPDKKTGTSATYGYHNKCLYVFTCSDSVFAGPRGYTPVQVLALLEYNGDFSKTAKDLLNKGFGKKHQLSIPCNTSNNDTSGSQVKEPLKLTTDQSGELQISDALLAQYVVDQIKDRFRYNRSIESFCIYKNGRFQLDEKKHFTTIVQKYIRQMRLEIHDAFPWLEFKTKQSIDKTFIRYLNTKKTREVIERIKDTPEIEVLEKELDRDPDLLNCKNGFINLRSGSFSHHTPDCLFSKVSGTGYDPKATCPKWKNFLAEIIPDQEIRNYLQVLVGYSLTGDTSGQALIILFGSGANGKSVFVHIMEKLADEYYKTLQPDALIYKYQSTSGNATPEIAGLRGVRFAVSPEVPEGRLDESLVKYLTGSDLVTARYLYGKPFTFRPSHKIWLTSNYLPTIRGSDYGIWRRIHVIPFSVQIPEEKRIPFTELCNDLITELPGILNWAIVGAKKYYAEKRLKPPEGVTKACSEYKRSVDTIETFITDQCIISDYISIKAKDLYKAYSEWCHDNNEYQFKSRDFYKNVELKGFEKRNAAKNHVHFFGISLKEEF